MCDVDGAAADGCDDDEFLVDGVLAAGFAYVAGSLFFLFEVACCGEEFELCGDVGDAEVEVFCDAGGGVVSFGDALEDVPSWWCYDECCFVFHGVCSSCS